MLKNTNNSLTNHFDKIALQYDAAAYIHKLSQQELVERLKLLRLQPKRILSLGSGTAIGLKALSQMFPKAVIHLLDASNEMLRRGRAKITWRQKLFKSVRVQHAQAEDSGLEDESIELVLANLLLPYLANIENLFAEVQRVTHAQGVFCFTSFGPDTLQELQAILAQDSILDHSLQFGHLIDMHILGDQLLKAGFREPVMDVDVITLTYSSFDALWKELTESGIVHGDCSEEVKTQIEHAYRPYCAESGEFPVTFEIVYGQAWANSNLMLQEKAETMRDGVFNFPLEQLRRR